MLSAKKVAMAAAVFGLVGVMVGCGDDAPPPAPQILSFPISVTVTEDGPESAPIAKVPVLLDGKPVGYTDKDGKFSAVLSEQVGKNIAVSLGTIDGYKFMGEPPTINEPLRVRDDTGGGAVPVPLFLKANLESTVVESLIWVKAACDNSIDKLACANLEVKVGDETMATTDEHGHAHFVMKSTPNKTIKLSIITPPYSSDDPDSFKLEPSSPEFDIELGRRSNVYVVDRAFSNGLEDAARRGPRARPSAGRP